MFEQFGRMFQRKPFAINREERQPEYRLEGAYLENTLQRLGQTPEAERYPLQLNLYQKLLKSVVLLPVPTGTDIRNGVPLMALENDRGEKGVPVFTSEQTLAQWQDHAPHFANDYVAIPFPVLCDHVQKANLDYVLLNVAGPFGGEIGHQDFAYLAEGLIPPPRAPKGEFTIEPGTDIRLAAGNNLPDYVTDRLRDVFRHNAALIDHAYVFQAAFGPGPLKAAIAIRMPAGTEHEWEVSLWPNIQAVLQEMMEPRDYANVILLNQAGALETNLSDMMAPFYTAIGRTDSRSAV